MIRTSRFVIAAALVLSSSSSALAQAAGPADGCAGRPSLPPVAKAEWVELPGPNAEAAGDALTLRVTNLGDVPADVLVAFVGDAGDGKHHVRKARIDRLPPHLTSDVAVSPSFLGGATKRMTRAGQLLATLVVEPSGAEGESLASPPAFFHRASSSGPFAFYGEDLLRTRHGGGDFGGVFPSDPETTIARATDDGNGRPLDAGWRAESSLAPIDEDLSLSAGDIPESDYELCFGFEIGLTDAGKQIVNKSGQLQSEDVWNGYSQGHTDDLAAAKGTTTNMLVSARGVGYKIHELGAWQAPRYAHPTTGCVNFSTTQAPPFKLQVLAEFRDDDGNSVRVHDGANKTFSWATTVDAKPGKRTVVLVGDYSARATLAAVAGFSMYRSAYGLTDKTIEVAEASFCGEPGGAESSAHFDFDDLGAGLAHVRIHDGQNPDCSATDHRRQKFIISHELGHAWLLLRTGQAEPSSDTSYVPTDETVCSFDATGYSLTTLEYSSIGFREGAAHLYATRVWNDKDDDATFTWFTSPSDAETNNPDLEGGRLWNVCDTTQRRSISNNLDWLRFWWDWYASSGPGSPGGLDTIADVYADTILNGGLARENYWQKLGESVNAWGFAQEVVDRFDCASSWNGVDTSGIATTCNGWTTPP